MVDRVERTVLAPLNRELGAAYPAGRRLGRQAAGHPPLPLLGLRPLGPDRLPAAGLAVPQLGDPARDPGLGAPRAVGRPDRHSDRPRAVRGQAAFDVIAMLGFVILAGLVVNNAILIVHQANNFLAQGLGPREALAESARSRLRPILMSVITTVAGMTPLALGAALAPSCIRGWEPSSSAGCWSARCSPCSWCRSCSAWGTTSGSSRAAALRNPPTDRGARPWPKPAKRRTRAVQARVRVEALG